MCSLENWILCQGENSILRLENMLIHPISITHVQKDPGNFSKITAPYWGEEQQRRGWEAKSAHKILEQPLIDIKLTNPINFSISKYLVSTECVFYRVWSLEILDKILIHDQDLFWSVEEVLMIRLIQDDQHLTTSDSHHSEGLFLREFLWVKDLISIYCFSGNQK